MSLLGVENETSFQQISFLARVPPLGIGVYQLLEALSSETALADYNLYHHDKANLDKPYRTFNIKEIQNALDEIMLENSYMKVWFSGISGLVEVCYVNCLKIQLMGGGGNWNTSLIFFPLFS